MLGLDSLEIGLMFWASPDARATLREVKSYGVRSGQLGFPGSLPLHNAAAEWDRALTAERFIPVTAFCSYVGEDYSDISAVARTVGLTPLATRRERVARTKAVSNVAKELGIDSVACHIGLIPAEASRYHDVRNITRELCDFCVENGQSFTLETGQEPARVLLSFMEDVDRPNLKINFDPANMILYGTGDPLEAFTALSKYVISVHCKDGDWPPREQPEALGVEAPLGKGAVDIPAFLSRLKEAGYTGTLNIECEENDPDARRAHIRDAVSLLRTLLGKADANAAQV
jgi:L-ribulose-5-phosphate 3-epimerase